MNANNPTLPDRCKPVKRLFRLPPLREVALFVADCLERMGLVLHAAATSVAFHQNECEDECACYLRGHQDAVDREDEKDRLDEATEAYEGHKERVFGGGQPR